MQVNTDTFKCKFPAIHLLILQNKQLMVTRDEPHKSNSGTD